MALLFLARGADAATYEGYARLTGGDLAGVTGTLDVAGGRVAGTLALTVRAGWAAASYQVTGRQRRTRLVLAGTSATGARLRWKGVQQAGGFSGKLRVLGPKVRLRGTLLLGERPARSTCDDVFRTEVMARVLLPICASCHRAGGAAVGTRLQVYADDAAATRRAVAAVINTGEPSASLLLAKPTGGLNHGGGAQLAPDAPELTVLRDWAALASTPACGSTPSDPDDPGVALYLQTCASCHGTDGRGVGGRPAIRCNRDITDAVRQGRPGATPDTTMPPFPLLTDTDIALLQGALEDLCPAETATGAELFTANCGSCHGADALGDSGPAIRCSRSIRFAVQNGIIGAFAGYMPPLMRLQDAEVQKIQDHLLGLCAPTATGADLFGANCAACHGTTGAGDHGRPDVRCTVPSRVHHAVYYGRGFPVEVMPTFTPALNPADEAKITGFLQPYCSNQGADLFASNCATCHGPNGQGGRNANGITGPGIRCSDSSEVYDAVTDGTGGMPAIADLSNSRIDAIVAFLRVGCP